MTTLDAGLVPARRLVVSPVDARFALVPGDRPLVVPGDSVVVGAPIIERLRDARLDEFEAPPDPAVRIRLGDLLPLVAMAQKFNFIWLKDFLDDEVAITSDLHEVLQAFRSCRPSA